MTTQENGEEVVSRMVTVEVIVPTGVVASDVATAVENELSRFALESDDGFALEIGAVTEIDSGLIDDGVRWRGARKAESEGTLVALALAKSAVAQAANESRGALERAAGSADDADDRLDLLEILQALDAWTRKSIDAIHGLGSFPDSKGGS